MRGCAERRSSVCNSSGLPAIDRYCFGTSLPKRAPRPAAGTTHHSASLAIIPLLASRWLNDLVEHLAGLDQAKFRTRTLLDRVAAGLQILHFGRECLVALL